MYKGIFASVNPIFQHIDRHDLGVKSTVEFDEREKVHLIKANFCNVSLDVVDGNGDDDKNINNYVTMRLIMMIVAWSYLQRFYMELVDDNDDNHADHDDCILVQIGWR